MRMNVNIPYNDMILPLQGSENPFGDRDHFLNQNALAGHVKEQAMTDHSFRQQHLTHAILGYSANLSVDPNAPDVLSSLQKAEANNFATIGALKAPKKERMESKRKPKGDLEIVDEDGAYEGPWSRLESNEPQHLLLGEEMAEEEEEEEPVQMKKVKPKCGAPGLESSMSHGKSMYDYQGQTYMHPPIAEASQLQQEVGSQESFIPNVCIHTTTTRQISMYINQGLRDRRDESCSGLLFTDAP